MITSEQRERVDFLLEKARMCEKTHPVGFDETPDSDQPEVPQDHILASLMVGELRARVASLEALAVQLDGSGALMYTTLKAASKVIGFDILKAAVGV